MIGMVATQQAMNPKTTIATPFWRYKPETSPGAGPSEPPGLPPQGVESDRSDSGNDECAEGPPKQPVVASDGFSLNSHRPLYNQHSKQSIPLSLTDSTAESPD